MSIILLITLGFLKSINGGEVSLLIKDAKGPITHLYLDYDKTLTVHDFSVTVRDLFCKREEYPSCDCSWLPGGLCNGTDAVSINGMAFQLSTLPAGGVIHLIHSFGGLKRANKLRSWLKRIRKLMKENVFMVSSAWYPITAQQRQAYLFQVSQLLNLGFQKNHILTQADPGPGLPADKGGLIRNHMKERHVKPASAMFADENAGNIKSAKGVCHTLHINNREGMDDTDRQYIEALAGGLNF